jgi:hypothetical protein
VNDFDDRGPDELERQLDTAFASTRPRRGFEDELWRRLQARQPWWQRLRLARRAALPALGGLAAVLVAGFLVAGLASSGAFRGLGHGASGSAGQLSSASTQPLAFGPLPRPAVPSRAVQPVAGAATQPAGDRARVAESAGLTAVPAHLPVYRYEASAALANGTVLEQRSIPPGLVSAEYPTRQPGEAAQEAQFPAAAGQGQVAAVTVTQVRLVYIAVTAGSVGYLEPAYELTGTAQVGDTTAPVRAFVPAVAASALR